MQKKVLLWFGKSQTGKSSSIKLLTGDETIQCGVYGEGRSTTSAVRCYEEKQHKLGDVYCHIDSIGLGDNRLKYDDKEILNHIENEILKISKSNGTTSISAIIVT